MAVKEIVLAAQGNMLKKYEDLFWIITHALGGVILQTQFNVWLSRTNKGTSKATQVTKRLMEVELIKKQKFFRNNLLILCKPALVHVGKDGTAHIGTRKIMMSAAIMEIILRKDLHDVAATRKYLETTSFCHYGFPAGYTLLNTLKRYEAFIAKQCPAWNMQGIAAEKERMAVRINGQQQHIAQSSLNTSIPDLFNLEFCGFSLQGLRIEKQGDTATLHVNVAYINLCHNKDKSHRSSEIATAIHTIEGVFGSFSAQHKVQVHIIIYSHSKENLKVEEKTKKLVAISLAKDNRQDSISDLLSFIWLDTSDRLFSHISVENLI